MRVLRWLGIVLAVAPVLLVLVVVVARFSDGPIAIFAGGPLESGEIVPAPADWTFASDVEVVEFQLVEPPRSRTVWIVEHEGNLYVPCGFTRAGLPAALQIVGRMHDDATVLRAARAFEREQPFEMPKAPRVTHDGD